MGRDQFNKSVDVITSSPLELGPPEIVDSKAAHTGSAHLQGHTGCGLGIDRKSKTPWQLLLASKSLLCSGKRFKKPAWKPCCPGESRTVRPRLSGAQPSDVLARAFDFVAISHPDDLTLDLLSLHLTLYRQLRFVFESESSAHTIADLVHDRLDKALRPGQPCADLLVTCLESSVRTRSLRAAEALSALGRMVDVLPPPSASSSSSVTSNPLVPLFQHAATAKDLGKSEMVIINALFPHVPASAIPDGLRQKLLADMDNLDGANLRSSILAQVLVKTTKAVADGAIDTEILTPILPLFVKDDSTTLLNVSRYLLPALFSARPSTMPSLLATLSQYGDGEEAFSAWISVASLGVASGLVDISDLPADDLRDAIAHADSSVQLRAFQLLIGTKHLLRADIMVLIKESFSANAVLSSAG